MGEIEIGDAEVTKCYLWKCPKCNTVNHSGISILVKCEYCENQFFATGNGEEDDE